MKFNQFLRAFGKLLRCVLNLYIFFNLPAEVCWSVTDVTVNKLFIFKHFTNRPINPNRMLTLSQYRGPARALACCNHWHAPTRARNARINEQLKLIKFKISNRVPKGQTYPFSGQAN